jgi:ELWxxDGT repeat protein
MKIHPPSFWIASASLLLTATSGLSQGVQILKDINIAPLGTSALADEMAVVGNKLYISTDDDIVGSELWLLNVAGSFNSPKSVALDGTNNVYVADTSNHAIRKITTTGIISTLAGGLGESGSFNGSGIAARFSSPRGVAVLKVAVSASPPLLPVGIPAGTVYVADTGNHVIRRISPDGAVMTLAGTVGSVGTANGSGSTARFSSPRGLVVRSDGSGIAFVADTGNHTIRQISAAGRVDTLAGTAGSIGSDNATGAAARFSSPQGVAVDIQGNVFVADTGNHLIRKIDNTGTVTTLAGGAGQSGSTDGTGTAARFSSPEGIATDTTGNLYVADAGNHTIRKIVILSGVVTTLAGTAGQIGSTDATGAAARFATPSGVAADGTNIYVADTGNQIIRKTTAAGVTTKLAGIVGVAGVDDGAANPSAVGVTPGIIGTVPSLVKDILPGSSDAIPTNLTPVGSNLFFTAVDSTNERDIWVSDGTNGGTKRVGNNHEYDTFIGPEKLTNVNGTLYFAGRTIDRERELWKSDGTTLGTTEVLDINSTPGLGGSPRDLFSFNGNLFLVANDGGSRITNPEVGAEIWKSNGTAVGTTLISDVLPGNTGSTELAPPEFTNFNGFLYFSANGISGEEPVGRELFRTNGQKDAHVLVKDIEIGAGGSSPSNLVVSGATATATGRLYFIAGTTDLGRELCTSDGTLDDAGTVLVDIKTGTDSAEIANLTPIVVNSTPTAAPTLSNRVVFTADNGLDGAELWHSDGNTNNTQILKELTPGADGSILANFVSLSSSLVVFTKEDVTTADLSLWRTDGTANGTVQIEDFLIEPTPGTAAVSAKQFRNPVRVGSTLYFMMGDDELWKTNGINDAGTVRVHRFRSGSQGSSAQKFTQLANGKAVFSASSVNEGNEPWITDGTPAGTVMVGDLVVGSSGSDPMNFTAGTGSQFFFTAELTPGDREVHFNNGSTDALLQINASGSAVPENLFYNNGTLFFSARNNDTNAELWKTDGTTTALVKDLNTDGSGNINVGSYPGQFAAIGGTVYFAATNYFTGRELYKTDDTLGAIRVKDISALGSNSSHPEELVVMPATGTLSTLYFIATGSGNGLTNAQNTGRELWKSNGTDVGTVVVKNILAGDLSSIDENRPAYLTVVGTTLFFAADDGVNGRELWKSDGTALGTVLVKNIAAGITASDPTELRSAGGKLFFLANDGVSGRELWVSNGTAAGTVLVKDLVAGLADASIDNLTVINNIVCFAADDGLSGREVWLSDGTAAGTRIAFDAVLGSSSSNPNSLSNFGNNLLFAASDSDAGNEPRIALMAPKLIVEQPAATALTSGTSTVDFTPSSTVAFGQKVSLPFVLKNDGITSLNNVAALVSGPNAAEFTVFTKPATSINGGVSSTMVVLFTPKEGGPRTATLTILSTDVFTPSFLIQLTGNCAKDPTVTLQPVARMVNVGEPVTFTSAATSSSALTQQWRKNAASVVGAISSPYKIFATQLTQAGTYSVQFKNGVLPAGLGTSNNAELGVVEDFMPPRLLPIKVGTATTTIAVNATGNGLTYLWKRSAGGELSLDTRFKNFNTKILTITAAALGDSVDYFCEVTGPGGMRVGGTTHLQVYNGRPNVDDPQGMPPNGIVSRMYSHQIKVAAGDATAPVSYSAAGLPPGVTVNTKTGLISGRPTKAGIYNKIKINATNAVGADLTPPVDQSITIVDMPTGLDGVYVGLIEREANLNESLGGRIDLTVTALTGAFSGSLTMGSSPKLSFKGGLDIGIDGSGQPISYKATVTIPRTGILAPLTLTFTIDPTTKDRFSVGDVASQDVAGVVSVPVTAWKQIRKATPLASSASAYLGLYNLGLRLPVTTPIANPNIGDNNVPQGNGYASFMVAAAGTLTITGRTPDGETLTGGAFVGPSGEVLIFQPLYTTVKKGSILGQLNIGTGTLPLDPTDNVITGELDWVRPPNPAVVSATAATRTYRSGFGLAGTPVTTPVGLEAFGGFYKPPTTVLMITTPSTTVANASVRFTDGGVNGNLPTGPAPSREPNVNVAITATSTANVIGANSALTKITPNRTTGAITGSFALSDDNLRTVLPITPDPVLRAVTFQGLIVPEGGGATHRGVGYFMLPQIPIDNTTLPTTTLIYSGMMVFTNP